MRISLIYTQSVGPLADGVIKLEDDWSNEIEAQVLFTGNNGCGKSTLLRGIAILWEALGIWLSTEQPLAPASNTRKWLERWGGIAIIFEDFNLSSDDKIKIGLFYGSDDFFSQVVTNYLDVMWIGEISNNKKKNKLYFPSSENKHNDNLIETYKYLGKRRIQSLYNELDPELSIPNIVYLDAEARKWVNPTATRKSLYPDDLNQAWLATYTVTNDWNGQIETSLFNLKATLPNEYPNMIKSLNYFFSDKRIDSEILPGTRQQIILSNGRQHTFDELSSGEHQILIMLFTIQRWLKPGGIVLIDEPDLHLHPSVIAPLLAAIENIVTNKKGQLILTSHSTEVWQRYEKFGSRIDLTLLKGSVNVEN
ncbi:TPA: AAA family ATPase [Proteus mirabilis]